jgi:hypothetical protein
MSMRTPGIAVSVAADPKRISRARAAAARLWVIASSVARMSLSVTSTTSSWSGRPCGNPVRVRSDRTARSTPRTSSISGTSAAGSAGVSGQLVTWIDGASSCCLYMYW